MTPFNYSRILGGKLLSAPVVISILFTLFALALLPLRTLLIAVLATLIELFHFDNTRLREVVTASE